MRTVSCDLLAALRREPALRVQHRVGDALIGAAAAQVSAHAFAHALRIVAGLPFVDQTDGAHDLAGSGEAARQTVAAEAGTRARVKAFAETGRLCPLCVRACVAGG